MTFADVEKTLQVKDNHLTIDNNLAGLPAVAEALHAIFGADQINVSSAVVDAGDTALTITGCIDLFGMTDVSVTIQFTQDGDKNRYSLEAYPPAWPIPGADWLMINGAVLKVASAPGDTVEGGLSGGSIQWKSLSFPAEASLPDADGAWTLSSTGQSIDLSSPGQLAQLVGLDSLGDALPPDLLNLGSIPMDELSVGFTSTRLLSLSATISLLDQWDVIPGTLALKDIKFLAKEVQPAQPGAKKQVKLLLFGTVAIGKVEVPITPENLSGGKTWEVKLNSDDPVQLPGLPDLFAFAGVPDLAANLPDSLAQLSGLALSDVDLSIDLEAKTLDHAAFTVQSAGPWVLPGLTDYSISDLKVQLDLTSPFDQAKRKTAGSFTGMTTIKSVPIELDADLNEEFVLNGHLPELSLASLVSDWLGTSLPQGLSDVDFKDLAVTLSPKKKSFSLAGSATTTWTLPFGDGQPETSAIDLHFLRDPEKGNKCLLALSHSGDLAIPGSGDVTFHSLSFGFDYQGKYDWNVVGAIKATAFNVDVDMQLGEKTQEHTRTFVFKGILVMFPASLAGVASLNIYGLEVQASKDLEKPAEGYEWSVSLAGVLDIEEVAHIEGKALVEKKGAATSFSFEANNTQVSIPLGIPDQDISLVMQLNSLAISRTATTDPWTFTSDVAAGLVGLPDSIQKYLPAAVDAILSIDETGTALTIDHLLPLVDFIIPDATVSGVGVKLGLTALEMANFKFSRPKGQKPSFSLDLGVGLPANLNDTFGTQADGSPKTWIFNTYIQGEEDTITRFDVSLSSDRKVGFHPANLPFGHGGQVEPTYVFDFGDFGQLSIDVPSIQYDGKSFAASGGFCQPDLANHPLKVPLTPLKKLLEAMALGLVAKTLPDGIPLKKVELVDAQGQFETGSLASSLKEILSSALPGSDLPADVTAAIDSIGSELDRLPDAFKNYFHAVIPDGFHFALGMTDEGELHIELDVETPEGEPPQAIKYLTLGFAGVIPALNGIQLYRLSFDTIAGDALQLLRLDAVFEQFDILTLAASLAVPRTPVLSDPSRFVQRWSIRDLYLLFALEVGEIIPIPLFFGDLGLEFYSLFGLGGGLKFQFPIPTGGLADAAALVSDLKPFVTDADALLPPDLFSKHNLALMLGIQPAYLELPPYLGGDILGTQGQVFEVDLSDPIVSVLNALKKPNLGKLAQLIVTILPLQQRLGSGSYSLGGILNVQAAYLLTTPAEFMKLSPPPVEATLDNLPVVWDASTQGMIVFLGGAASIGSLVSLKAVFGLALTEAGFATRVHVQGALSRLLQANLEGDMRITTRQVENGSKQTAFALNGHSRIYIFDHLFLSGDLQMDDTHLFMDGAVQVFPDSSLLQMGGNGRLWIDRDGNVSLNTSVSVSLLHFDLTGATLDILRSSKEEHFQVTATWLGAQVLFAMGDMDNGQGGRTYQITGAVSFPSQGQPPIGLLMDTGPITIPGTSLRVCDNIHLDTSVSAALSVTLSSLGFAADVSASFSWNGKTWAVDFHLNVSFASLDDLVKKISQEIASQAYTVFQQLWADVLTWLKNIGSGTVGLATNEIGPALLNGWHLTVQQALAAMLAAGSAAEGLGSVLAAGYHLVKEQAAQFLKDAGYAARDAIAALASGFNLLAGDAAGLLKQVGYGFTEIAAGLKTVYKLAAADLAAALKFAQYQVEQIASGLRVIYNLAQQGVYKALQAAGFALDEVQKGVQKAFNLTQQELAALIAGIGASAVDAARKIQALYHLTWTALADALRSAGYPAQEVAGALKTLGNMLRDTLAAVMTEAGYFAKDVAESVKTLYNETAAGVAAALHAAGAAVRDVAVGVQAAFSLAPYYLAQVLKDAQYTALAIAQGLKAAFNAAAEVVAATLKEVGYLFNDVASSVKQVYYLAEDGLARALRSAGYAADQVAAGVKSIFNSTVAGLAAALKAAEYSAAEVAIGINTVFSLAANVMAGALKALGYAAKEVGAGLAAAYKLAADVLGNLMTTLGYTVNEVAGAVQAYYQLAADALTSTLRAIGYAYRQVAAGVQAAYNLAKEQLAAVLKAAGYALNEVADSLRQVYNLLEGDLAVALKAAGYAIDEIAAALQSLYNLAVQGIAAALRYAGYAAQEVADLLANFYQQAQEAIGKLLIGAGYALEVVAGLLRDAYHWLADRAAIFFRDALSFGAAEILNLLKAAGYALDEIAAALKSVFGLLEKGLAEVLKAAGYLAADVARLLTSLYQSAEELIAQILFEIGYAAQEVVSVMNNLYHWLADHMAAFFHDVLQLAAEVVAGLLKAAGYALAEIMSALNKVFDLLEDGLAVVLRGIGYAAREVAEAFTALFHTIGDVAARALNAAGYLAGEVVDVLKNGYSWLAGHVAQFFKDTWNTAAGDIAALLQGAGYLFDEIAGALKSVYNLLDRELAALLRAAGYLYSQVAAKVQELYALAKEDLARALKAAGYALEQVASGVKQALRLAEKDLALALQAAGYVFDEVAAGLQSVFHLGLQALTNVLKDAGYAATQVAGKLKQIFVDATLNGLAAALKTAGYLVQETTAALQLTFNAAAGDIASALNAAGYAASEIAGVLKDFFHWAAGDVASFMKDTLGYGNNVINAALSAAQYTAEEIGSAMSSVFGAIGDTVGGFFGDVGSTVASWF